MLPTGRTAAKQREKDRQRLDVIREEVSEVRIYWECEINAMLQEDIEMRQRFKEYLDEGPLNIRSCFMGGRTGPTKLFHKAQPGEKISYLDVTSLYPFINYIAKYMVGHPKVHILNEQCDWSHPSDNPFPMALMKVLVVPPKEIDVPVLPMKLDDDDPRLLFPLCASCAREYPEGGVDENYTCEHTERERQWVSSCTSIELNEVMS